MKNNVEEKNKMKGAEFLFFTICVLVIGIFCGYLLRVIIDSLIQYKCKNTDYTDDIVQSISDTFDKTPDFMDEELHLLIKNSLKDIEEDYQENNVEEDKYKTENYLENFYKKYNNPHFT